MSILNCYSLARVAPYEEGGFIHGGLVGLSSFGVRKSYAAGPVTGWEGFTGGLIGHLSASPESVVDSYWDTETSGCLTSDGGAGKTTAQMKQQATFAGWDFATIWQITENVTYPTFRGSPAPTPAPGLTWDIKGMLSCINWGGH